MVWQLSESALKANSLSRHMQVFFKNNSEIPGT